MAAELNVEGKKLGQGEVSVAEVKTTNEQLIIAARAKFSIGESESNKNQYFKVLTSQHTVSVRTLSIVPRVTLESALTFASS